MKYIHII